MSDFELRTPRLVLDELRADDLDVMCEVLGDAESMRWYPAPFTRAETRAWIERCRTSYAEHGFGLWAVRLAASGELVGDTGLMLQEVDGEHELEVGWHVHPAHQRRGIATEAGEACVRHAFHVLRRSEVISLVRPENVASRRVAEKLGMRVERSTVRGPHWHHDVWVKRRRDGARGDSDERPATAIAVAD